MNLLISERFKKMMSLSIFALIIFILSACTLLPKEEELLAPPLAEPVQVSYRTVEVLNGDITNRVTGQASFTSTERMNVFFEESGGRLEEVNVRLGDEVEEGDVLARIDSGNLHTEIRQTEINLEKTEIRLAQLRNQGADWYSTRPVQLDIEVIQMRLDALNQQLEKATLRAPMSGTITFLGNYGVGDNISRFQTFAQITNPDDLQLIYTAPTESRIREVDLGMEVTIIHEEEEFRGEVIQTPRNMPQDLPDAMENLFRRSILISYGDDLVDIAEMGVFVTVEIIVDSSEDTLILPRGAIRTFFSRNYVQVMEEDENVREVDVGIGIETATHVEILEGLQEGDKVIMR